MNSHLKDKCFLKFTSNIDLAYKTKKQKIYSYFSIFVTIFALSNAKKSYAQDTNIPDKNIEVKNEDTSGKQIKKVILDPSKAPSGCRADYALKKYVCLDGRTIDPSTMESTPPTIQKTDKDKQKNTDVKEEPSYNKNQQRYYEYQQDNSGDDDKKLESKSESKARLGLDFTTLIPVVDGLSIGVGGIMAIEYKFNENVGLGIRGGYIKHFGKSGTSDDGSSASIDVSVSTIPVFVGFKAGDVVYFVLDFGYVEQSLNLSGSNSTISAELGSGFGGAVGLAIEGGPVEIRAQIFTANFDRISDNLSLSLNIGFRIEP